jgi:hypothetical protein
MNVMLATEATAKPLAHLEAWPDNERMRHIPTAEWMAKKLDVDLRHRIDKLFAPFADLPHHDPAHAPIEEAFRGLCRALDHVADVARRPRGNPHPPAELGHRLNWAISHAIGNLQSTESDTFGRRFPFHTFERSNAEPLYAALLAVIERVRRLEPLIRAIDPGIDERLYEDLVKLNEPLRKEPMA